MILKAVRQQQGRLILCSINEQIKMLLEISETSNIFEVFSDQASFTQCFSQS
jgi:anti-anti-sigma regulatory factor